MTEKQDCWNYEILSKSKSKMFFLILPWKWLILTIERYIYRKIIFVETSMYNYFIYYIIFITNLFIFLLFSFGKKKYV